MLEIGSLVDGKYKILRVVGKGGMSVVYQAVNEKANKIWAIKEVRKDGVQNFEVVKQNLIVETELLKKFNHPNLPSIIDVIDGEGSFLIVMDYIEGNSLAKALETSGAQSQDDVIEWSKQLCDVLGYLHSRRPPVIYRDMKPANVMLKPDGNVSLIDFGTAREFKSSSVEDTTCLGTQGYAAPEQYGGHGQTDARTDIYCLGATMYHLVTGHNPSTPPYEMYPIRQWNPMLSSGLEEIIIKCTQRNPNDRYQSCAELLYALDHYQDLDIENKKAQTIKWNIFLTSAIITVVMILCTIGFKIGSNIATANEYDSFIEDASVAMMQDETDKARQAYANAIAADDSKIEAYSGILKMYTDRDSELDKNEYKDIVSTVTSHENSIKNSDGEAYANLCKEIGDAVFFLTDDSTAPSAANWYQKASKSYGKVEDQEHAEYLYNFASTYQNIGKYDPKTGNPLIEPHAYYDGVLTVLDSNHFNQMTVVAQIKCCEFVALQLSNNNDRLLKTSGNSLGIEENEYIQLLDNVDGKIRSIESSDFYQQVKNDNETLRSTLEETKEFIDDAKQIVSSASIGNTPEGAGEL